MKNIKKEIYKSISAGISRSDAVYCKAHFEANSPGTISSTTEQTKETLKECPGIFETDGKLNQKHLDNMVKAYRKRWGKTQEQHIQALDHICGLIDDLTV